MLASNLENEANNYSLSMSGPIGLSIRLLRNVSNDTPLETMKMFRSVGNCLRPTAIGTRIGPLKPKRIGAVSYTHLRAHET